MNPTPIVHDLKLQKSLKAFGTLIVVAGLFISIFKIFTPYSYWLDELYSVNASALPWGDLHQRLLSDVHPPLYQAALKIWMTFFGSTEPSTRTLSWLFSAASLLVALKFSSKLGSTFFYCVAVCFSANMLFTFYANETRAYAMTLFLSTLILTLFPFRKNDSILNSFFAVALILSLTHYFGLILVGVLLGLIFVRNISNATILTKTLVTGLACLIWPLHHIINGSIANKTGGNFWIKIESPLQSISTASGALMPGLGKVGAIIFLSALILGCSLCFFRWRASKQSDEIANIGILCSLTVLIIALLIAIVDSYTPMSTTRNYIVIVPFSIFALAATTNVLITNKPSIKKILLLLVTAYSCLALYASYREVANKSEAKQDWKNAIQVAAMESGERKIYFYTHNGIVDHYFKENSIPIDKLTKYSPNETKIGPRSVVVYGHLTEERYLELEKLMQSQNARHIFPAENRRKGGHAGVFVLD